MNLDLTAEQIARVCHEANRGWQAAVPAEGIPVAPAWDEFSSDQQAGVIEGVRGVIEGNSPSESHESWCDFKTRNGWVYGPVKDELSKTHPCLVPYDELPPEQRIKDSLFIAVVSTLARVDADERFPYDEADTTVIGPQCFAAKDGSVLNWRGENYVPQGPALDA